MRLMMSSKRPSHLPDEGDEVLVHDTMKSTSYESMTNTSDLFKEQEVAFGFSS
jgi:hypothetical protein